MTDDKKFEYHPISQHWSRLNPEVRRAVRQSLAEWLAKEYAPPAEVPVALRDLLARMEEEVH